MCNTDADTQASHPYSLSFFKLKKITNHIQTNAHVSHRTLLALVRKKNLDTLGPASFGVNVGREPNPSEFFTELREGKRKDYEQ